MGIIKGAIVAATMAAAAGWLWTASPGTGSDPGIDMIESAAIADPIHEDFTVSNMESGTACLLVKGRQVSARSSAVIADPDCNMVWPRLERARNWTQNADGTVLVTDDRGASILTLTIGDGIDFVALEPSNAVVALMAAN